MAKALSQRFLTFLGGGCLAVLLLLHPSLAQDRSHNQARLRAPVQASVTACFVPAEVCVDSIVAAISAAKTAIRVQAYGFTSAPIISALAAAKRRGIDVQVILDKSNDRTGEYRASTEEERPPRGRYSGATYMANAGVPVFIDIQPAIAHNKLIIIDGHLVIGGSYNYTQAAEHRNAENVTFIDSPEVAGWYLANWQARKEVSRPYMAPTN
jgi:phosphatidylserine/phosphatidylglycerophosphate/cardiolipin synthase-like enzyme